MVRAGFWVLVSSFVMFSSMAFARTPSPESARVYLISPATGEAVGPSVAVKFGLQGMGVAPAGIDKKNTGHHHLLIDLKGLPALDKPIPSDKNHKHFGKGQTETTLKLSPGKHTLQLILGDKSHVPFDPPVVSEKITIWVR
ncbi:MAG TPA: DUF4399 domain-containing protein [Nitrospiria bacterium]|nr:DUF4399 domain-containing protein [Candidatus Manganitrophaceae bacterium]HIL33986.1 DUF4399 domain-containing protein [Candidatus Manganitrophaceae bacterium]